MHNPEYALALHNIQEAYRFRQLTFEQAVKQIRAATDYYLIDTIEKQGLKPYDQV